MEGTAFINLMAVKTLISPKDNVEKLLMGSLSSCLKLAVDHTQNPGFNKLMLIPFLSENGTMDANLDYPYRDDALKLWAATQDWMTAYVNFFYKNNTQITSDKPLQQMFKTLAAPNGGGFVFLTDFVIKLLLHRCRKYTSNICHSYISLRFFKLLIPKNI